MRTLSTVEAMNGIRELDDLQWYVVPLLSIVLYIYATEIRKAREKKNWDAVIAGLTLFGMDFLNETWNSWLMVWSDYAACWTTPGRSALKTAVGWNIEIMFMFSIAGIVFYNMCSPYAQAKVLGLPDRWFWAIAFSAFSVFVECGLNKGNLLIWEYWWWNRSVIGIIPIFCVGYFHFFAVTVLVLGMKTLQQKCNVVIGIWTVGIVANFICLKVLGWNY